MELKDTISLMQSNDYKERFEAEYYQTVIRYKKLKKMVTDWTSGKLNFDPTCPLDTYQRQLKIMSDYIAVLQFRAMMEEVEVEEI